MTNPEHSNNKKRSNKLASFLGFAGFLATKAVVGNQGDPGTNILISMLVGGLIGAVITGIQIIMEKKNEK